MTRITEGERRKIAADLRENRDPLTPYNLVDYIFEDPWNHNGGEEVADRLADLIEPEERTCRVIMKWDGLDGRDPVCSECGTYFDDKKWHEQKFCPSCGAKVVEQ